MKEWTHVQATALAHESACILCGAVGTCVPAHFPHHRGTAHRADSWNPSRWVPACGQPGKCHDAIDGRNGVGGSMQYAVWQIVRDHIIAKAAAEWWPLFKKEET